MSADFHIKFGSYDYAAITGLYLENLTDPLAVQMRASDTPGRAGGYSSGGTIASRRFALSGKLVGTSTTDLRSKWRAFRAAHAPGAAQKFYTHSDTYRWAEPVGVTKAQFDQVFSHLEFEVEFLSVDPYDYEDTPSSATGLAGGGTVTTLGQAPSPPTFTLTVGGTLGGTITLTNTRTGEAMNILPTATGAIVIDSRLEAITRSGVNISGEMSGLFLSLAVGANVLTVSATGGTTVTVLSVAWNDRYV